MKKLILIFLLIVSTAQAQWFVPNPKGLLKLNNIWTGTQTFGHVFIDNSLSLYNLNGNRWFYADGSDSSLTINGTINATNILDPVDFANGKIIQEYNGSFVPVTLAEAIYDVENTWTAAQAFSIISSTAYKQVSVVAIADSVINCDLSNTFSKTLGANQRFVLSNVGDGQTVNIAVTNTASNYTVLFVTPTGGLDIKWADGTTPVQTVGAKTDVWTFVRIGTVIYGNVIQNF